MEALGPKIRKYRRRLGLTLDDLAGRTGISKPYLSLIETGRVTNPPSDEKLRRLEQALAFTPGELVTQAHIQRTPRDVQAMLQKLMAGKQALGDQPAAGVAAKTDGAKTKTAQASPPRPASTSTTPLPLDLDAAYMSGVLQ